MTRGWQRRLRYPAGWRPVPSHDGRQCCPRIVPPGADGKAYPRTYRTEIAPAEALTGRMPW
jgi:hypothetical protein